MAKRHSSGLRLVTRARSGFKYWIFQENRGTFHRIPWAGDMPKAPEKIEIPAAKRAEWARESKTPYTDAARAAAEAALDAAEGADAARD